MAAKTPTITTRIDDTTGRSLQGLKHIRLYFDPVSSADWFVVPAGVQVVRAAAQADVPGEWMTAVWAAGARRCTFGCSGAGITGWLHLWVTA